jgi:ribonuclease HII
MDKAPRKTLVVGTMGSADLVLGIDEAGRGPGLGPMVVAAVALDEETAQRLAEQGVRDSKAFGSSAAAQKRRAELRKTIEAQAAFCALEVCDVETIDEYVQRGALNILERDRAVRLIDRAPTCTRIVADGRTLFSPLQTRYPHLESHDRGEGVHVAVAAASVCAKALRDELFAQIALRYESEFGPLRGGGYVNPATMAFVNEHVRRHGCLPPEARRSWPWPGITDPR